MKFIEIEFWTNEERGLLSIRPNKIAGFKKYGDSTKLYIEGFPNVIAINKTYEEVKKELTNANLRTKVPKVRKSKGNPEIDKRPNAKD